MALIYKITNKYTGTAYIGKTTRTIEVRLQEHHRDCEKYENSNIPLYNAIQKYGWDSFDIELIETNIPNDMIDEKEQFYIAYYDTYNNGYNATRGGDGGRTSSKLSSIEVKQICEILNDKNSLLSFSEIGALFHIDESVISRINSGETWHLDEYQYPIRKYNVTGISISRSVYQNIVNDIQNTTMPMSSIEKKYNLTESQLTAINWGRNCYGNSHTSYYFGLFNGKFPIRQTRTPLMIEEHLSDILYDIIFTNQSMAKIGEKYSINGNTLQYIANGKRRKELTQGFILPLRKNLDKNKQIYFEKYGEVV